MKKKIKKVFKYGTGQTIPKGAIYLTTIKNGEMGEGQHRKFVWHYFLVEVEELHGNKE